MTVEVGKLLRPVAQLGDARVVARQADALLTFDVIDSWSHRWLGGCVY